VAAGTVKLVGTEADRIVAQAQAILSNTDVYELMARAHNPYGDGNACGRIAGALLQKNTSSHQSTSA
jgi:UDP-N-acetylglucosamine 2-epimerase (non-hydrolysing)